MKYKDRLKALLAEESSNGAALRGGTSSVNETARARIKRLGQGLGISLSEWLQHYADDLAAIESDPELTDTTLLAFMRDYAHRRRLLRSKQVRLSTEHTPTDDYKRHHPAALAALQQVFQCHRNNLSASGYPPTQARVSIGDWLNLCKKNSIPAAAVTELTTSGAVSTEHGFVLPSAAEV